MEFSNDSIVYCMIYCSQATRVPLPVILPIRLLCLSSNFCSTLVLNLAASSSLAKFNPAWAVCNMELKQIIQNILNLFITKDFFSILRLIFKIINNNNFCLKYSAYFFYLMINKSKQVPDDYIITISHTCSNVI